MENRADHERDPHDAAPGDEATDIGELSGGIKGYIIGLVLAGLLTGLSFLLVNVELIWRPALPMALIVLAVAQMGIHLVFFLHVTTGPDNTNNVLTLAYGVLIVGLVIFGSIWIMNHLHHSTMPLAGGMHGM